jgi:SAM-dependent methyltransferase
MLSSLRTQAAALGLPIDVVHAAAEAIPVDENAFDLVVIADALHFLDAELTGIEVARVLEPGGALAIVTSELADTPFMRALIALMEQSAPRRPRDTTQTTLQLAALADVTLAGEERFVDHVPVDHASLKSIVRSISFIGPAINAERFDAFWRRVQAIDEPPVWSRALTLRFGHRAR